MVDEDKTCSDWIVAQIKDPIPHLMHILLIYRHPSMGFSIGKVFKTVERELRARADVETLYMPCAGYKPWHLWRNIRAARRAVKNGNYDIVHITGAEHYLIPFLKRICRVVVTIHDLGFFTNHWPSIRAVWKYLLWIKPLAGASHVTFISQKSRLEAERFVKFRHEQSSVIMNSVDPMFVPMHKDLDTQHPRILHIGTKPNKNLNNIIIALHSLPCHLRIIGDIDADIQTLLDVYGMEYSIACNITDEQICHEYAECDIVSFASLYEGFGMPIVEGQATGRVVVTSDISPMREVAGGGAVLVYPYSTESIRKGFEDALARKDELVAKGFENVSRFQVGTIVGQYVDVYKNLIQCE